MEISKIYPLDAVYDNPEDTPEDVILLSIIVFCCRLLGPIIFLLIFLFAVFCAGKI